MTASSRKVHWDRLDRPGTEVARLYPLKSTWHLQGKLETELDGVASKISYHDGCDAEWRTRVAGLRLRQGGTRRRQGLTADPRGRWHVRRKERADPQGCIDVDIEICPATNTLPIRRLALKEGEAQEIRTAWLRVPEPTVEPTRQRYTRIAERRYRFENLDSGYAVEMDVDDLGLVVHDPGGWGRSELLNST